MSDHIGGMWTMLFLVGAQNGNKGSCLYLYPPSSRSGHVSCGTAYVQGERPPGQLCVPDQHMLSGADFLILNDYASVSLSIRWGIMKVSTSQVQ